jgi:dihydrofolate synthase/folylpolyglutamate synthase
VLGAHQAGNLALAVRAAEVFLGAPLSERALAALGTLALPARLERLGDALLDAAHTRESIAVLTRVFAQVWPGRRAVLALSVNRDKDAAGILAELSALGSVCVVTRGEPVRAIDPTELGAAARAAGFERVEEIEDPLRAVRRARALCSADDVLVATGSFYFAGAVRRALVDFARATQEAPV